MNLNDATLNDPDINQAVIDDDIIHKPAIIPTDKTTTTIVVQNDDKKLPTTSLSETQLATLPNSDVTFNMIEGNITKVIDLKDVEASIIAKESMSRSQAEYVHATFENFIGNEVNINEFTYQPSQVNLLYTKLFMKSKIAKEELNIVTNFELFIDKPLEDARALLTNLESNYLAKVKLALVGLKPISLELENKFNTSKDLVVQYGDSFANISTMTLNTIDFTIVKLSDVNLVTLALAAININKVLEDKLITSYIFGCIDSKPLDYIFSNEAKVEYAEKAVSGTVLINFYKSDLAGTYLDDCMLKAEESLKKLKDIQDKSHASKTNFDSINTYIIAESINIQNLFKDMSNLVVLTNGLSHLSLNIKPLLEFYQKL